MTLADVWGQVWPNLLADALWTAPVWLWHHTRLRRLLDRQREHIMREMREHLESERS